LCRALPGGSVLVPAFIVAGAWVLMIVAMMLPATLPLVSAFERVVSARADRARMVVLLLLGYVAAWGAFGLLAHGLHELLLAAAARVPALASTAAPTSQPCATNQPEPSAARCSAESAAWATRPNANQTTKKPSMTSAASRPASERPPVIRRNIASSGNAVGSIIATIISTQAAACSVAGTSTCPCGIARQKSASAPASIQPGCAT